MQATLALFVRSLRIDARSIRPHLARLLIIVPSFLFLYIASEMGGIFGAPGLFFFKPLAYLNFVLITLAGAGFFSTAITEEKEESTLGLLRMAGVSPLALLLGKSTTRLFSAALILSVQFPFTLLAATLGGITSNQVIAIYLALLSYMLLISSVGLLCSVYCSTSGRATTLTTIIIALLLFGPTILSGIWFLVIELGLIDATSFLNQWAENLFLWLTQISAFHRMGVIPYSGFTESPLSTQVIVHTLAAVVVFLIAWLTFDLFNREQQTAAPARGLLPRVSFKPGSRRGGMPRAWSNALAWKDFNFLAGGKWMSIMKFIAYLSICALIIGIGLLLSNNTLSFEDLSGVLLFVSFLGLCLETSLLAGWIFREETRWNTLANLVMLPNSIPKLAYAKLQGCLLGLVPAVAVFCLGAILHPSSLWEIAKEIIKSPWHWVWLAHLLLFLHLIAYTSLRLKWGALPLSIAMILLGDFFIYMFFVAIIVFSTFTRGGPNPNAKLIQTFFEYLLPLTLVAGQVGLVGWFYYGIGRQLKKQAAE